MSCSRNLHGVQQLSENPVEIFVFQSGVSPEAQHTMTIFLFLILSVLSRAGHALFISLFALFLETPHSQAISRAQSAVVNFDSPPAPRRVSFEVKMDTHHVAPNCFKTSIPKYFPHPYFIFSSSFCHFLAYLRSFVSSFRPRLHHVLIVSIPPSPSIFLLFPLLPSSVRHSIISTYLLFLHSSSCQTRKFAA